MAKKYAAAGVTKSRQGKVATTTRNGKGLITPPKGRGRAIPKPLMK